MNLSSTDGGLIFFSQGKCCSIWTIHAAALAFDINSIVEVRALRETRTISGS